MATLLDSVPEGFSQKKDEMFQAYQERQDKLMAELSGKAAALPEGEIAGAIIKFPVADNYAYYLVAKKQPLEILHIPFGDAYQVAYPMIRGLRIADVQQMVARERSLKKLFSEKRPQPETKTQ